MSQPVEAIDQTEAAVIEPNEAFRARYCCAAVMSLVLYVVTALPVVTSPRHPDGFLLATTILAPVLILLTTIDFNSYRLPDVLTLPLIAIGILLSAVYQWDGVSARLLAAAVGFASLYFVDAAYRRLRGRAGLGLGDAKLLAAAGAWLGLPALSLVVLIGSLAALIVVAGGAAFGFRVTATTRIPFGPFLAFGFWLLWLYGPII